METYRQPFENILPKRRRTQFLIFILLGLLNTALGISIYYKDGGNSLQTSILIIGGIGYLIMAFIQKYRNEKYFIEFNNNGIDANISAFKSISIKWDEIKEIEIKPISIIFKLNSDLKEELSLSASSYESVIKIKKKIKEFASKKDVIIVWFSTKKQLLFAKYN